jgi:hypothetical protein
MSPRTEHRKLAAILFTDRARGGNSGSAGPGVKRGARGPCVGAALQS